MHDNQAPANLARYPLLLLAVCFGIGIVLEKRTEVPTGFFAAVLVAASLFAVAAPRVAAASLSIAFVALGAITLHLDADRVHSDRLKGFYDEHRVASGTNVRIEGVAINGPEPTVDGVMMAMSVNAIQYSGVSNPASGNVRVYVLANTDADRRKLEDIDLGYGHRLQVECPLRREENYQNPGVFSGVEMLDQQGIDAICTAKGLASINVLGQTGRSHLRWIFDKRREMIEGFRRLMDPPTAGVMIASLLGDKYFVDRGTAEVFRDGGTFHILVISGLHITVIGGLALFVVALFTKRRVWRFTIATGFLWAYTLAVGAEIPVVRASLMFTILLFSQIVRRDGTLLNSLGLCALVLLTWRPEDLFTASFQLTFVSVAAIVGTAFPLIEKLRAIGDWRPTASTPFPPNVPNAVRRFCETLYWREDAWQVESKQNIWTARLLKSPLLSGTDRGGSSRWFAAYLFEGLLVSAIVQTALLPWSVFYFHRVAFASIFLNLWVGAVLAIETAFALAAVAISYLSDALAAPFAAAAELFNRLLIAVPSAFTEVASFSIRVPVYSGHGRIVYPLFALVVAVIGFLLFRWTPFDPKQRRSSAPLTAAVATGLMIGGLMIFHPLSAPSANGRLTVDFLDVGQGDSALVTFPDGQTMLIDGGGRFSYGREGSFEPDIPRVGERVVSEFLWEKGYARIDYVLATHADADHMQGLADVVRNFSVSHVYFARSEPDDPDYIRLINEMARKGVRPEILLKGDAFAIGEAAVEALHPPSSDARSSSPSPNDASLVVRIRFGSRSFLFAGDIEGAGESALVNEPARLASDVVKVPHHGSKTSSTQRFIDAADPEIAVISVGRRSTFGHPHADVVKRWKDSGASVLTTGENGTVTISTDGTDLAVSTFEQRHER